MLTTAIGFRRCSVAFYRRHGIRIERLLTDNGSAYVSARHALACLDARHPPPAVPVPTAPRQTARPSASSARSLAGWAYGAIYRSSEERTAALDGWLFYYNHRWKPLSPRPPTPG